MVKVFEKTKNYCDKWVKLYSSKYPQKYGTFWKSKKSEKLLKIPIFYWEYEYLVEMCVSLLITEILSFFNFNKNFMTK